MEHNKIRAVIITNYFWPHYGGAEFQLDYLASNLAQQGHEVTVLTTRLRNTKRKEIHNGYKIVRFGDGYSKLGKRKAYQEIFTYLKNNYKDLNLCYLSYSGSKKNLVMIQYKILKFLRSKNVCRVIRITSSDRITEAKIIYPKFISEVRLLDCIIALNSGIKKELFILGIPKNKIVKINNGVDTTIFKPVSFKLKLQLRAKNRIDKKSIVFIYSCRIAPKKNIPLLIEYWHKLGYASNNTFQFLLLANDNLGVEGFEEKNKVNKVIKAHKIKNIRIIKTDNRYKVAECYQLADICINFSSREGMCNSLLEGMSVGLRILCSDIVANRYIIKNTKNGYLFNLNNPQSIAKAFKLSIRENKNISENNILEVKKKYLISKNFQSLLEIMKSLSR